MVCFFLLGEILLFPVFLDSLYLGIRYVRWGHQLVQVVTRGTQGVQCPLTMALIKPEQL